MKPNRSMQLELLQTMEQAYPEKMYLKGDQKEDPSIVANLFYLMEHELIEGNHSSPLSGNMSFLSAKITAKGLDFLADDGGISAILGVVTVKLHADTIRQLLIDRVSAAPIPEPERASLLERIKSLPGKGLEKLAEKLLEKGADSLIGQGPRLFELLNQVM